VKMRDFLVFLVLVLSPLSNLGALELVVYPQKAPIGGINLSKGVVHIKETGEIINLSPEGYCLIDIPPEFSSVTVDIYIPGFQAAGGVFNSRKTVEIPLILQKFIGEEVVLDLGETASMVLAARSIIGNAANEAEDCQREDFLDPQEDTSASINPFYIIELVVGKSMSEILGLEKE